MSKNITGTSVVFLPTLYIVVLTALLHLVSTSPVVQAGEVDSYLGMSFGSIDLSPAGDSITIKASNGYAEPTANDCFVDGGRSGLITIHSTTPEQMTIDYPNSIILRNGSNQVTIDAIGENSEYAGEIVDLDGSESLDIHIGGRLQLQGDEVLGNYSSTMTVTIEFF